VVGAPFFAVGGFVGSVCQQGGPVQLTTSASRTYWASPLWRRAYTASLTARHHASVPGVGGATAPFTTSAAPISANSLRRVKSSVRRKRPTLLCRHRYSATASTNLSMERRGVCGSGGDVRWVSSLWGSVWELVLVYISNA